MFINMRAFSYFLMCLFSYVPFCEQQQAQGRNGRNEDMVRVLDHLGLAALQVCAHGVYRIFICAYGVGVVLSINAPVTRRY